SYKKTRVFISNSKRNRIYKKRVVIFRFFFCHEILIKSSIRLTHLILIMFCLGTISKMEMCLFLLKAFQNTFKFLWRYEKFKFIKSAMFQSIHFSHHQI